VRSRNITRRKKWSTDQMLQLCDGIDWFHDAWGNPFDRGLADRKNWPGPTVLAEMRQAWADCRDELLSGDAALVVGVNAGMLPRPLWGELVFDRGMSPQEASNRMYES
jgi:hypothetical protein